MKNLFKKQNVRDSLVALFILGLLFIFSLVLGNASFKNEMINQQTQLIENKMALLLENFPTEDILIQGYLTEKEKDILQKYTQIGEDRFTLLDKNANIFYDSDDELVGSSRANRPEIKNVINGSKIGVSLRESPTLLHKEFLYVAKPIYHNNQILGYARFAEATDNFDSSIVLFKRYLLTILGTLFLLIAFVIIRLIRQKNEPMDMMLPFLKRALHDPSANSLLLNDSKNYEEFYDTLNQLSQKLNNTYQQYVSTEEQFYHFIDELMIGVFIINHDGTIELMNPILSKQLQVTDVQNKNYKEVFENTELFLPIQQVMALQEPLQLEIEANQNVLELSLQYIEKTPTSHIQIIGATYDLTRIRELEQIQTDFLGNVSHELKTPVTSFIGFTETLLDGAMEDKSTTKSFLEIMQKDALRLQHLISEILQLTRDKNNFTAEKQTIFIHKLIDDLIETYQLQIQNKQLKINVNGDPKLLFATQMELFQPILKNLLENAIQYTPEEKEITITYRTNEHSFLLEVQDQGIGIHSSHLQRIFERFYRVDKARSRNTGGTGLGLSIVQNYTKMLNGTIEVESVVGEGTTFKLAFPTKK